MLPQEIFDTVVRHAFAQRVPARNMDPPLCRYRAEDGKKCFVGVLIPDNIYVSQMDEVGGVNALVTRFQSTLPEWFGKHLALLEDLQEAHDNTCAYRAGGERRYLSEVVKALAKTCEEWDLSDAVLVTETKKYEETYATRL